MYPPVFLVLWIVPYLLIRRLEAKRRYRSLVAILIYVFVVTSAHAAAVHVGFPQRWGDYAPMPLAAYVQEVIIVHAGTRGPLIATVAALLLRRQPHEARAGLAGAAAVLLIVGIEAILVWLNWTAVGDWPRPNPLHARVVYSLIPALGSAVMVLAVLDTGERGHVPPASG